MNENQYKQIMSLLGSDMLLLDIYATWENTIRITAKSIHQVTKRTFRVVFDELGENVIRLQQLNILPR